MAEKLGLRRLRTSHWRKLTRQFTPRVEQFIQPVFVVEGIHEREPVKGMSGVFRDTPESLLRQVENDVESGISSFLLFGVPASKRERGFSVDFAVAQIQSLKKHFGTAINLCVDVCLCSYTAHGHCGIVDHERGHVENAATVAELARVAAEYAAAGADCVAPSDMMDGRVGAIRAALTAAGHDHVVLMSYAAKFHSKFYGPFRGAADSAPKTSHPALRDRGGYQIDPGRPDDALLSARRDHAEGADVLMVKPGLPYLDVLAQLSSEIPVPWAVYEVSGEYAAVQALHEQGLIHGPSAHLEAWTAFCRAGASIIISYGARHSRQWLEELK
jgi:porphobilinogen synthase